MAIKCLPYSTLTEEQILNLLKATEFCSLATSNNGQPQVRPYIYAFDYYNGKLTVYFDIVTTSIDYINITSNPKVSIEFVKKNVSADNYREYIYDSIGAQGIAQIITDPKERQRIKYRISRRSALNKVAVVCLSEAEPTVSVKVEINEIIPFRFSIITCQ